MENIMKKKILIVLLVITTLACACRNTPVTTVINNDTIESTSHKMDESIDVENMHKKWLLQRFARNHFNIISDIY